MSKSNRFHRGKIKKTRNIYLDYASGAKPNTSSIHALGVKAKKELETARRDVALVLKARPEDIIFTSGGTESNNLAIQGVVLNFWELNKKLSHLITTNIEHPSVLETCKMLERRGLVELVIVSVEKNGIIDPKKIKKEIKKNTVLVSVMYANNEIGTIQPIRDIAKEIRHYRKIENSQFPFFHTDAVQVVNYLDLNVEVLGVDILSLSGSKIEESGRVGVLFRKKNVFLSSILGGGDQEMGLRPGTENLAEIIKFSKALQKAESTKQKETKRLTKLRDYFMSRMPLDRVVVNGDLKERLPNNVNITFAKIPSELLVIELSIYGIMASSKSACKSSQKGGSYVIQAINPELDPEIGGVRFSLGRDTTKKDIDYTVKILMHVLSKLSEWYK